MRERIKNSLVHAKFLRNRSMDAEGKFISKIANFDDFEVLKSYLYNYYVGRGGLVVGRRTCDLVVAGSRPGRDAAA